MQFEQKESRFIDHGQGQLPLQTAEFLEEYK